MTSGAPWSVKGIDPKAREIAKDLARRQGMTLGEWLNQMIFDDGPEPASEDTDDTPRRVAPPQVRPATESRPPRRTADDLERVLAAIDELSDRVQSTEQRQAHASARFEAALNDIRADQARVEGRLQTIDQAGGGARSDATMRALEGALGKIAGHVQDGERRSREAAVLLRRELTQEMQRATDQMARQVQDVENRSADAIAQVGAEVTRVSTLVEQRLRRADDAQAEALEKLGGEIARITERLSERIAAAERRSAQAIDDVGEQMARVTDRIHQRQERSSSELAERMRQSEERTAKMLEEAREKLERRLNKRDGGETIADEANAFAARWSGEEPPAPAALAAPKPPAAVQAPAPVQAKPEPEPEPSPAFLEPPPLGVDALLANIDSLLDDNILHAPQAFGRPEPQPAQVAPRPAPQPIHYQSNSQPAPQPAAPPQPVAQPYVAEPEPPAAGEILRPLRLEDFADEPEDLRPSTRDLIAAARAAARVNVEEPVFRAPEPAGITAPEPHPEPIFAGPAHRKPGMSGAVRGMLLTTAAVVSIGVAAAGYVVVHPEALAALKSHPVKTAEADKPIPVGPASNTAPPAGQAMALTDPKAPAPAPETDAEALFRDASARVDAGDASGVAPLRTAANLGYAPAQRRLGKLYEDGGAGVQKDEVEGRRWTQRAAANGDPRGMHNLGLDYYEGTGGIKNMAVAAQWFQRAAELGLRDSQYNLARFYEAGLGVKQDLATAYKWYLIAGRAGDTEAASRGEAMKMQLSPEVRASVEKAALAFSPDKPAPPTSMSAALKGSTPQQLALAQRALGKLGYYKGQDDGAPSRDLGEAIQSYQRDRGLAANGTLSPELMRTFANVTR
jgi:localization factor PodJL